MSFHSSFIPALAACLIGTAALGAAPSAFAQAAPMSDPSLDELREALSGPVARSRAFTRTAPPSVDGACAGDRPPASQQAAGSRALGVVPYAGSNSVSVNLAIQFATASDAIAPASQQVLDRLATLMKEPAMRAYRFAIAGHTDAAGSAAINLELSCARAIAVRKFLSSRGVGAERISAYGFGSSKPLQDGVVESATNRRVEIRRAE